MSNHEGMGRRATQFKNGAELDDILHAGRDLVDNNGSHSKAKTRYARRARRLTKASLRNGSHEEA